MQPVADRGLLIGGTWTAARTTLTVTNPANGRPVAQTAVATPDDVDEAVRRAAADGRTWASMAPDDRCRILRRAADSIRAEIDRIAEVLTLEQGKPLLDSRKEIDFAATVLDYYAEQGRRITGSVRPNANPTTVSVVTHQPIGTVGAIVPWNYPVDLYAWKVAPALAAGCPVIVKPPLEAPLGIGLVSRLITDAGLPPGTLSDLPGGAEVGQRLVTNPGIAMVTATCSTATGQAIMRAAADNLTRVSLELGGQSPFLVLPDADVDTAAQAAARRAFSNMGQICIAVNRVIVDDTIADEFIEALRGVVAEYRLGNPSDPATTYGPCTTRAVVEQAQRHIRDAVDRGAVVVVGGQEPTGSGFESGHYFQPTVVDHVPLEALVMNEETFGPVVGVHRVRTVTEAIDAANNTDFGLAAYVWGRDVGRAWAVAERIDAGGVGINVNDVSELQAPFGGWKRSGLGHELGPEGIMNFLRTKHVRLAKPTL